MQIAARGRRKASKPMTASSLATARNLVVAATFKKATNEAGMSMKTKERLLLAL
jgi:hypothetical protein